MTRCTWSGHALHKATCEVTITTGRHTGGLLPCFHAGRDGKLGENRRGRCAAGGQPVMSWAAR